MAKTFTIGVVGAEELEAIFKTIEADFGPKDQSRILVRAIKDAMQPALMHAKMNAPVDTGGLRESLRIEARKPTRRDKRSRYIQETDTVIATVTTAPGTVLARKKFHNYRESFRQKKDVKTLGIESDARAIAMEFGTAHVAAQPFLRPALESQSGLIVNNLATPLKTALEKYRVIQYKRTQRKA